MDNSNSVGRRTVLRGTATLGIASIAGCFRSDASENGETENESVSSSDKTDSDQVNNDDGGASKNGGEDEWFENGAVTFIYDDGPNDDLEQAFPAHETYDAPATVGIVSEWMRGNDERWMNADEVTRLADAGWEIASHTATHVAVTSFNLVEDVSPGDDRIYPEGRGQHGFLLGDPIEVTDGEKLVQRTVVESDDDDIGRYLELDEPIDTSFTAEETVERYTEPFVRSQLADSKKALAEFSPTTFLAPHDVIDDRHLDIVREYYEGVLNVNPGTPVNDIPFDPFDTNRAYFAEHVDRDQVYADLTQIAEENVYGVLGAHTHREEVTQDRIAETLEWCDELGIEVITFEDAISRKAAY
ncbi:polysaccharide deacetylase family protein [Haloterrigena salinisoli]|uniref:polysaccharide deacetylase family protein n=1 Tax=Haloterrigena salinisoli TaxID=3132747 RepID=UPI0030D4572B